MCLILVNAFHKVSPLCLTFDEKGMPSYMGTVKHTLHSRSQIEFYLLEIDDFSISIHRIGVSYYDSSIRQLYVLEVWDDGNSGFPLIDLGTVFLSMLK